MILDLNKYRRVIKPLVIFHIQRHPEFDPLGYDLSVLALITECHILATTYYVEEVMGKSEGLTKVIDTLQKQYHWVKVINKEES